MISSICSSSNSNNNNSNRFGFPLRCYIHATRGISESIEYSFIVVYLLYLYARVCTHRTLFNVKLNNEINTLKYYVFFF